uniref:Expressed protein n=1 Tax=Echinococcus granulosus TaxID=6210 RepID=A0A068WNB9_ECHGR|nr:expressed protein [Echinococcus granulosus]
MTMLRGTLFGRGPHCLAFDLKEVMIAARLPVLVCKRAYRPIVIRSKRPITTKERVGMCIAFFSIFIPPLFVLRKMMAFSEYKGP